MKHQVDLFNIYVFLSLQAIKQDRQMVYQQPSCSSSKMMK